MDDGYVLKSSVLSAIHNGDIDMGIVTTHEYYLLKKLSKKIDRRIQRVPVSDVRPVRHGRWEKNNDGIMVWWECSECHRNAWYDGDNLYDYCPNCGAKMDEAKHEQGQI